jgi:enediyne biosynthesis thioesterase
LHLLLSRAGAMKFYEYKQIVGFEETNLTGNVYFTNYFHWQGRAREHFLRDHAPEILPQLEKGLALITLNCSCSFLDEVKAFDEVTVRMFLEDIQQNRIIMRFEYWRDAPGPVLVARGEQQIACMHRQGGRLTPAPVPECLRRALTGFLEPIASH